MQVDADRPEVARQDVGGESGLLLVEVHGGDTGESAFCRSGGGAGKSLPPETQTRTPCAVGDHGGVSPIALPVRAFGIYRALQECVGREITMARTGGGAAAVTLWMTTRDVTGVGPVENRLRRRYLAAAFLALQKGVPDDGRALERREMAILPAIMGWRPGRH